MITFGYVKQYRYTGTGILELQVRVPSIHGPYSQQNAKGQVIRGYVRDDDLPWYQSLLLPHTPVEGEVVALQSMNDGRNNFIVIGLTGGSYKSGSTNIGG